MVNNIYTSIKKKRKKLALFVKNIAGGFFIAKVEGCDLLPPCTCYIYIHALHLVDI